METSTDHNKGDMRDHLSQLAEAIARATPPGLYLFMREVLDRPIEKWVSLATFIFVALQIFLLLHNFFAKDRRRGGKPK